MRTHRCLATAIILIATACLASAKTDLSGDWKLNTTKSDFGQMPAPSSMSQKITHADPKLDVAVKMSSDMGDMEWKASYTTDGKECKNTVRESPVTSVLKWDGDALTVESKGKFGDNDFTMKDKWTLSSDGKVLTIDRHFASSFGEGDSKLLFEKQ